jgi:antitoxin ParD1/3/4
MSKDASSIALGDHFKRFVDDLVASGRYASANEVLRAALRLLEALDDGLSSGPPEPFDFDEFVADMQAESARNA